MVIAEEKRAEIQRELAEIQAERNRILEEKLRYKKTHGAEYFKPYWYQEKVIEHLRGGKKIVVMVGSNQSGKTTTGSALADSFARGKQAWDNRISIFNGRPTKGRIICSSWESHAKETLIPKLREMLFIEEYETTKNNMGVEAFWKHKKTGSTFTIMCHTQETIAHESDTFDWCWADEPLPRDKYVANMRGLVARDGIFLMTMTSISQAWIYRELYQKSSDESKKIGFVSGINIRENKSLTEEAIKRFEESCSEEEREARIKGGWLQLTGLVWPQFSRELKLSKSGHWYQHVIKAFKIPPDWPVVVLIDPHDTLNYAVSYFTVAPLGRRYQIDEDWLYPNPKEIAQEIIRKKKINGWRLEICYIDPFAKAQSESDIAKHGNRDDTFTIMKNELNPFQIILETAARSREYKMSGITNIRTWLMESWGEPTLFFFDNCKKSIEEIELWAKDARGEPVDEDDHFCENLYRFSLTNTKYTEPLVIRPVRQMAGII